MRISQNLGYTVAPKNIKPCTGGCIHDSNVWEYPDGERFFVKFSRSIQGQSMLEAEFQALQLIADSKTVRCPTPFFVEAIPSEGFVLVMEYLELQRLNNASGEKLGHALSQLHRSCSEQFGLEIDNFIGATPQPNSQELNWTDFFWNRRIRFQLELAAKNGYSICPFNELQTAVKKALASHSPIPSLLHGDLWGGNAAALPDGTPVVFDPASYYGDFETDLAFTEVFGGFPASFYQAYAESSHLKAEYAERKSIYNLYHYLNHLNLFGSGYLSSCERLIQHLLSHYR